MNERIKVLADQARQHFPKTESSGEFWVFDEQKFAELIVKECARISNEVDYTMTNQGAASAQAFMEHFGVE